MYSKSRNIIIGFHGCDKSVRDDIILGRTPMDKSDNDYDWLGGGFYFWENNLDRALYFAQEKQIRKPEEIKEPSVLGAFIDLGYCLDLLDTKYLSLLPPAHEFLCKTMAMSGKVIPKNGGKFTCTNDLLLRFLDCAVIESLHLLNIETKNNQFDSVRGVFWEGVDLYPDAGFKEKNHIQICVRNPNCIKGYFIPRDKDGNFINP
ncbi:hypothetical protein CLV62_12514 [Dysgonomonas alginatilytica]|uniref:DUF3990 domain-containing protein n=1 Tax=Dysgonomonas alginatilytica TaxID=1605892 RepID=A0A2V3PKW9_9BACT|nr:hypothetical protein [Dysgonomonas alginatilytica]PXV61181.1 hypothetical protein CLV62_12514 [Dysgonomonas alginatilytica]